MADNVLSKAEFERIRDIMYANYGVNLATKKLLVESRLNSLVAGRQLTYAQYIDKLTSDRSGEEMRMLANRLTTNFTYFMREARHFEFLTNNALPEMRRKLRDHDLRTWSAGCSSGEEPYCIAMTLDSFFAKETDRWDYRIFASDISQDVLGRARQGVYEAEKVEELSEAWKIKYFDRQSKGDFKVKPKLAELVQFETVNLMQETYRAKKQFHIVFCRNVMIYFDNKTRTNIAKKFCDAMAPGGYLFIGLSETLVRLATGFDYVEPGIYRKPG